MNGRRTIELVVLAVVTSCQPPEVGLEGLACDAGECLEGYVCHPQQYLCVPSIDIGCDRSEAICPSAVQTDDPCPAAGAFVPCADDVTDCSAGCRTCGVRLTWGACSQ